MKKLICVCVSVLLFSVVGTACLQNEPAAMDDTAKYRVENGGFESGDLAGWSAEGNAFSVLGISDSLLTADGKANNKEGTYYFAKYNEGAEGSLLSGEFEIGGCGFITFRLGGAMNEGLTYISVVESVTEKEMFRFGNTAFDSSSSDVLTAYKADLSIALGKTARIKIVDRATANYGYICFDDFVTYFESEPDDTYMLAEDVKPLYMEAESTPSVPQNVDFSNGLTGWQTAGEEDCFIVSQIDSKKCLSNKNASGSVGVLRSPAFTVSGTGIISYRLGMTQNPELTYLSVMECGTNEELFRTYSDRWKTEHGESTHLYYLDLSKHIGKAVYLEIVDNSREEWGAVSFEALNTLYTELPMTITDETAFDCRREVNVSPTYSVMRQTVDNLAEIIEDPTMKKTFTNTFYATLDGFTNDKGTYNGVLRYNENGTVFCYTGDIHAMWLRDSSAQVLQYLQFMKIDEDVKNTVRGLLLKQFELIRRDPYANAFNEDGSVFERKFELDSLCYPLWLSKQYYDITKDTEIFNRFFEITLERLLAVLQRETAHIDANYSVIDVDKNKGVNEFENCGLIWSGYRPSDDVCYYKFYIPGNMFVVAALEDMVEMFDEIGLNADLRDRMAAFASSIRQAIETYGVYNHPKYGKIYAFEVDGSNADANSAEGKLLMDAANIPSLISAPWLGYCSTEEETYLNTRAFALSEENPYYYEGEYASGIGDPHDMVGSSDNPHKDVPVPWHMAIAMQGLTSTDQSEKEQCVKYMTETTGGMYVMHEAFNANNPSEYSRDYFTWPCSLYAQLVLVDILGFNLLSE